MTNITDYAFKCSKAMATTAVQRYVDDPNPSPFQTDCYLDGICSGVCGFNTLTLLMYTLIIKKVKLSTSMGVRAENTKQNSPLWELLNEPYHKSKAKMIEI